MWLQWLKLLEDNNNIILNQWLKNKLQHSIIEEDFIELISCDFEKIDFDNLWLLLDQPLSLSILDKLVNYNVICNNNYLLNYVFVFRLLEKQQKLTVDKYLTLIDNFKLNTVRHYKDQNIELKNLKLLLLQYLQSEDILNIIKEEMGILSAWGLIQNTKAYFNSFVLENTSFIDDYYNNLRNSEELNKFKQNQGFLFPDYILQSNLSFDFFLQLLSQRQNFSPLLLTNIYLRVKDLKSMYAYEGFRLILNKPFVPSDILIELTFSLDRNIALKACLRLKHDF